MWRRVLIGLVAAVLMTIPMISWHEIGHVTAARLMGDPDPWFSLYSRSEGGHCCGCAS